MSLDIDWSSLHLPSSALATKLTDVLNRHLKTSSRPSFIGPIEITAFNFGSTGPDVELKDVRDVWRAFDEADEEGDHDLQQSPPPPPPSFLDDEAYELVSPIEARDYYSELDNLGLDDTSIYSGLSPRQSVTSVGMGFAPSALHFGMGKDYASAIMSTMPAQRNPSLFSQPHLPSRPVSRYPAVGTVPMPPTRSHQTTPASSPSSTSTVPSLQLHLKLTHQSDLSLTIITSLSINYPSPSFMSLPLRLTVTGLTVNADLVLAYSGNKNRVYLTLVEEESNAAGSALGERLLPSLSMETEIGHSDAHVLRNVGKVEKFIADVIRKTLVDELVFPNFQTVAL